MGVRAWEHPDDGDASWHGQWLEAHERRAYNVVNRVQVDEQAVAELAVLTGQ